MLSSVKEELYFYDLSERILYAFLSEIICETSQTPIKTFLYHFKQKIFIFSDISLSRLGKNMGRAM